MSIRLMSKARVPHGGEYAGIVDPLTGVSHRGLVFANVLASVVTSRKAMGVPVGAGLEEEVERWICERYPVECKDVDPDMPRRKRLTLDDVIRGAKVLASFMVGGRKLVSPAEAEQRVKVCLSCPMNQGYSRPCSVCTELRNLILSIVGNRRTSVGDKLKVCGVCGCSLDAAVWVELKDQCKGVTPEMRKEFSYAAIRWNCWKRCGEEGQDPQGT